MMVKFGINPILDQNNLEMVIIIKSKFYKYKLYK